MVKILRDAKIKFMFDMNLQLRYGTQWDPTNAASLLRYVKDKGYDDIFNFEMGNGELVANESCFFNITL